MQAPLHVELRLTSRPTITITLEMIESEARLLPRRIHQAVIGRTRISKHMILIIKRRVKIIEVELPLEEAFTQLTTDIVIRDLLKFPRQILASLSTHQM